MPLSASDTIERMGKTVFCVAPTGDSDGFTQRFYYILAAGCIPVRVDTYYSAFSFGRVAWPFKQTIDWRRATILLPPDRLKRDGLLPTLRNVSASRIAAMQRYIKTVVRPSVLFNYRGTAPDAYSAFLDELIHLSKTKLPRLDQASKLPGRFSRKRRGD
uniref:Exostosin GT47 domain-containing protein n=1 Tax=Haptolina ericina TaxID=156174 RepID=A0A7S3AZB1_9EUKA